MRIARPILAAGALVLGLCAVAAAAVLPTAHTEFFYRSLGKFSISLGTKSAKQIAASKPMPTTVPYSEIIVVCSQGSTVTELQMGFPGAKLKLNHHHHHYAFSVSYTEKRADLVTFTTGAPTIRHESARATVTGQVEKAKTIAGSVSVSAAGCSLKRSSYKATPLKPA